MHDATQHIRLLGGIFVVVAALVGLAASSLLIGVIAALAITALVAVVLAAVGRRGSG